MKSSKEPVPLVVNTMGWNNGLGLCLLKDILLIFKPTHVIQINHSKDANKNLPVLDKIWLSTQDAASPENKLLFLFTIFACINSKKFLQFIFLFIDSKI